MDEDAKEAILKKWSTTGLLDSADINRRYKLALILERASVQMIKEQSSNEIDDFAREVNGVILPMIVNVYKKHDEVDVELVRHLTEKYYKMIWIDPPENIPMDLDWDWLVDEVVDDYTGRKLKKQLWEGCDG